MRLAIAAFDLRPIFRAVFPGDSWATESVLTVVTANVEMASRILRHAFSGESMQCEWPRITWPSGYHPSAGYIFLPAEPTLCITGLWETVLEELCLGSCGSSIALAFAKACSHFGLSSLLARAPRNLSRGELTLMLVLAALAARPRAVVLGCGLCALDPVQRIALSGFVRDAGLETALVAIETYEPALSSRVWWLDEGMATDLDTAYGNEAGDGRALHLRWVRHGGSERLPRLRVNGLAVSRGTQAVFGGITFQAGAGDVIAVRGRNGVGKTSFLQALLGWIPTRGTLDLEVEPHGLRGVAYAPDGVLAVPTERTMREELLSYCQDKIHRAGITAQIQRLSIPDADLDLPLGDSRTHCKLTSVLQALLYDRALVLLDEPTLALPARHRQIILSATRTAVRRGSIVFVAGHDESFLSELARQDF